MPQAQAVVVPAVKVEDVVRKYIEVRDLIRHMDDEHTKAIAPYKEQQNLLTGWMQEFLDKAGADSVKTPFGTCHFITKYSASLADPDAFMKYVISTESFDMLDRKANVTAVKDFVNTTGALPPGVNLSAIKSVGVRSPTRKAG